MPRFYFNAHKGGQIIADLEGEILPDIDAVRRAATASAREALAIAVRSGNDAPLFIEVIDSTGAAVFKIALKDVLPKSIR